MAAFEDFDFSEAIMMRWVEMVEYLCYRCNSAWECTKQVWDGMSLWLFKNGMSVYGTPVGSPGNTPPTHVINGSCTTSP